MANLGDNILDSVAANLLCCGHATFSAIPSFVQRAFVDMRVPSSARNSVLFIGEMTGGRFIPRATGFLVATGERDIFDNFAYLVTAEHVIVGMAAAQKEVFVRFNLKDGSARIESMQSATWWYHPTQHELTDVAVAAVTYDWDVIDQQCIPLFNYDAFAYSRDFKEGVPIGLGTETFAIGLFRSHYGKQRNMPIIRVGNIAAMPEEPISTKHGSGYVEGYLVEMRSIAGLSGSPVFAERPEVPVKGFWPYRHHRNDPEFVNWFRYHFLGLIHGHFDVPNPIEDMVIEDSASPAGVNTGVGVVIPAKWVVETLYQPDLNAERGQLIQKRTVATPDSHR